ncbi:MAG: hypothetical protein O3B13_04105 [Planctomycetota bacterium]|nr:hypothetical protein [Planctomycetota bacterium]
MRVIWKTVSVLGIFGLGYLAGSAQWAGTSSATAQGLGANPPGEEVTKSITAAYSALQSVRSALNQEGRYKPATKIMNIAGVMGGGIDAIADLESGRGVDPETFGALYAGHASDEVSVEIDTDQNGRLTYKGKVVRMYSIERLKQTYQERLKYIGQEEDDAGF